MGRVIFLFLSLISGAIELGGVLYSISVKLSIMQIVGIGLAYQIGNLVPNPLKLNKTLTCISSLLSILCFLMVGFWGFNYWILFAGYVFIAMSIQSLRSLQKESVGTTIKRIFRILGFIVAPFMVIKANLVVALILSGISLFTKWHENKIEFLKPRFKFLNGIMLVHQIHYFSYAYFILIIISNIINGGSSFIIGALFTLGWLTYTSVSHIVRKETYVKYFVIGHFFLSIVLVALAYNFDNNLALVLWVLTGFGGGTVFCIEKINKKFNESSKSDIVFSENIGHIIGVILGMAIYMFSNKVNYPVYLSAIFAFITMSLMLVYNMRKSGRSYGLEK